jgi:hypothetical protein
MKLRLMSKLFVVMGCGLLAPSLALSQAADPAVKKSESGICHDKTSSSYGATKKFEAFPNLDACLKSGGRASQCSCTRSGGGQKVRQWYLPRQEQRQL